MNYLLRTDRSGTGINVRSLFARGHGDVTEKSRGRWAIKEGDRLLLVEGHGLETRFLGTAIVDAIHHADLPDDYEGYKHIYEVSVTDSRRFSAGLSLEEMMYSLERISNFTHPWLHLRQRGRFSDADVEALEEEQIDVARSIYFGLLHDLPENWRRWFDLRTQEMQAAKILGLVGGQGDVELPRFPVRELLALVHDLVLSPVELGSDVHALWNALGLETNVGSLTAVTTEEAGQWRMGWFLEASEASAELLRVGWRELQERSQTTQDSRETRRTWRPHRW